MFFTKDEDKNFMFISLLRYKSHRQLWYRLTFQLLHNTRYVESKRCGSVPFGIVRRKLPTNNFIGSVTEMLFLSPDVGSISNGCSYESIPVSWKSTLTTSWLSGALWLRPVDAGKSIQLFDIIVLPSCKKFLVWCHVPHTIDDLSIHFDGIPWWDDIVLLQVFFASHEQSSINRIE